MRASISGVYANEDSIGVKIFWSSENKGFGEITISKKIESGDLWVDSEAMSKEFVMEVLSALVNEAELF